MWRHIDITTFLNMKKKIKFFNFWLRAHLAYKMNPIKIHKGIIKSQHCQIVPLIKFAIKDLKMAQNIKKWLPYPYLAPYNTREED